MKTLRIYCTVAYEVEVRDDFNLSQDIDEGLAMLPNCNCGDFVSNDSALLIDRDNGSIYSELVFK